jgi:hypothetical protein
MTLFSLPDELYPESTKDKVVDINILRKNKERERVVKELSKKIFDIHDSSNEPPPKRIA